MTPTLLPQKQFKPLQSIERDRHRITKRLMLGAGLFLFLYAATRLYTLALGPSISLEYPKDGTLVHDSVIKVLGRAERISSITLNGHPVYTDSYGYFDEKLLAPYGYSILELTAKDRFGRTETKRVRVIYQ